MGYPITSIIILTKNNIQFTERCIFSIYESIDIRSTPYEIIILDEDSIDGTKEFCELHKKNIKYVNASEYKSFASRNNYGATLAKGKFLWFLNNDTELLNDNIGYMLKHFQNPQVGVVGNMHLFPDKTLNHIGMGISDSFHPEHIFPHEDPTLPYINHGRFIDIVTAASIIVRKDIFDEVGGFDESYTWGYEDVDFMLKIKEAGYLTYCDNEAKLIHFGQSTYGRQDDDSKNREIFLSRWKDKLKPNLNELYKEKLEYKEDFRKKVKKGIKKLLNLTKRDKPQTKSVKESPIYILQTPEFTAFTDLAEQIEQVIPEEHTVIRSINDLYQIPKQTDAMLISTSHFAPSYILRAPGWVRDYRTYDVNYERTDYSKLDYWTKLILNDQSILLASSSYCQDFLLKSGVPEERVHVVPHGYNPYLLNHDFEGQKNKDKINVLVIINTNDESRYGTQHLANALELLRNTKPEYADRIHLIIKNYGGKPTGVLFKTKEYLQLLKSNISMEYITDFLTKDDLAKLYYRADLLIAPFRGEGFGMKILDAAAAGMPIISPFYGGPTDYLKHSTHIPVDFKLIPVSEGIDYSLLVQDDTYLWAEVDHNSLADKIAYAADHIEELKKDAIQKRDFIRENFSYSKKWERIKEIDEKIKPAFVHGNSKPFEFLDLEMVIDKNTDAHKELKEDEIEETLLINTINISNHLFESLKHLSETFDLKKELKGEILIVDDGSGENPDELLKKFNNLPIRYMQYKEWAGPAMNKEVGLRYAKGDHIIITGDDIKPMPGFFKRHYKFYKEHPEPYILMGHVEWDKHIRNNPVAEFVTKVTSFQFKFEEARNQKEVDFLVTPNLSFRKSDIKNAQVNFKKLRFFEDLVWGKDLMDKGFKLYYDRAAYALHNHQIKKDWYDWLVWRSVTVGENSVLLHSLYPSMIEIDDVSKIISRLTTLYPLIKKDSFEYYEKMFDETAKTFNDEYHSFEKLDSEFGYEANIRRSIYKVLIRTYTLHHFYGIALGLNKDERIAKSLAYFAYNKWEYQPPTDISPGFKDSLRWFIKNGRKRFPMLFEPAFKVGRKIIGRL